MHIEDNGCKYAIEKHLWRVSEIVVLGFYVPPTAKVILRRDLGLKSHLKDCVSDKYLSECTVVHRVLRQL